jgi:ABC-type transport system substrate-binding protein
MVAPALRRGAAALITTLLAAALSACGGAQPAVAPTAAPVVQTVLVEGTPQTVVVTATPAPATATPAPSLKDTIIIGTWQEPRSFLEYANSQAIRAEIDLLHRPRWVMRQDFKLSANPELVDGDLPTFDNGGAQLVDVTVQPGEPIFDIGAKRVISATAETQAKQLVVTGKIKSGLKWSDGQPLTTADFIYAWKLSCDPESGAIDQTYCPFGASPGSGGVLASYTWSTRPTRSLCLGRRAPPCRSTSLRTLPRQISWKTSAPPAAPQPYRSAMGRT